MLSILVAIVCLVQLPDDGVAIEYEELVVAKEEVKEPPAEIRHYEAKGSPRLGVISDYEGAFIIVRDGKRFRYTLNHQDGSDWALASIDSFKLSPDGSKLLMIEEGRRFAIVDLNSPEARAVESTVTIKAYGRAEPTWLLAGTGLYNGLTRWHPDSSHFYLTYADGSVYRMALDDDLRLTHSVVQVAQTKVEVTDGWFRTIKDRVHVWPVLANDKLLVHEGKDVVHVVPLANGTPQKDGSYTIPGLTCKAIDANRFATLVRESPTVIRFDVHRLSRNFVQSSKRLRFASQEKWFHLSEIKMLAGEPNAILFCHGESLFVADLVSATIAQVPGPWLQLNQVALGVCLRLAEGYLAWF